MSIQTRIFGHVEVGPDAPFIKQPIHVNGRTTNCRLYIAEELAGHPGLGRIAGYVDDIEAMDRRARQILRDEFEKQSPLVIDFLDFHLEELHDELARKLGTSTIDRKLLLENLELRSIAFHPDEADFEFWLDYCPGEEFSDELLVVKFFGNGQLSAVAHES